MHPSADREVAHPSPAHRTSTSTSNSHVKDTNASAPSGYHTDTSKLTGILSHEQGSEICSSSDETVPSSSNSELFSSRSLILTILVGLLGGVSAAMFVGFGIAASNAKQEQAFHHLAEEFALQVHAAWIDYETSSRWVHQACAFQNITRHEFRDLYEYISISLEVESISWVPTVLHEERAQLEEESKAYFAENNPEINYGGIQELYVDPTSSGMNFRLLPRNESDVYYPAHLVEPLINNTLLLEFDVGSIPYSRVFIEETLKNWEPTISAPFRLFPGTNMWSQHNTLMILHPGIPLKHHGDLVPKNIAMILIHTDMVARRILAGMNYDSVALYLYDSRDGGKLRHFLIAVDLSADPSSAGYYLPSIEFDQLTESITNLRHIEDIPIALTNWTIVVVALDDEFTSSHATTITAGVFIFVACAFVAFWIWWDTKSNRKIQLIRRKADADNAAIKLKSVQENAKAEQELNDYIAHEIRNPLAAAMSACSFVKSAVDETQPLCDEESRVSVREDVQIIDSSLTFINDLLRSMLDMHKAASKRMNISVTPADVQRDILQPVAAMLYQRNSNFKVLVQCPDNLIVLTDKLRLKQIILNLGRNSSKFVEEGFIKLAAQIINNKVYISVEDTGPGIPKEKQANLFKKFQESLDVLEQGTGMGLCLCKNLAHLLGGDLVLDESYDSGVNGCPGTRFIVDANLIPLSVDECQEYLLDGEVDEYKEWEESQDIGGSDILPADHDIIATDQDELPVSLMVLFVDDDMVLRKLFSRSVKSVISTWTIHEAANGESGLQMALEQEFDLIFLDQYMASAEKTMLGTETARAMRSQGIKSVICGLSANDMEQQFLHAGADYFLQKPFPCKHDELRRELLRILVSRRHPSNSKNMHRYNSSITTVPLGDSESSGVPDDSSSTVTIII